MKLNALFCASLIAAACGPALAQTCDEWAYLDPAPAVNARVCAYDPSRGAVLSFTLTPSRATTEATPAATLAIQDGVWTTIATGPDLRVNFLLRSATAMAFDPIRGRMVLNFGTTWELVDGVWTQAASGFTARSMVFDSTRGKIVALASATSLREWDGVVWTEIPTSGVLTETDLSGPLLHDPSRDELWVISATSFTIRSEGAWRPSVVAPWSADGGALVAYVDPQDGAIHVVTRTADHRWAGGAWSRTSVSGWPSGLTAGTRGSAWDPVRREVVVINLATALGRGAPRSVVLREGAWISYTSLGLMPLPAQGSGLVYDSNRQRLIGNDVLGTVEINGSEVRALNSSGPRPLAYDPVRDLVLGEETSGIFVMSNDRWTPAPPGMQLDQSSSATFDPVRGRIVGVRRSGVNSVGVFSFEGDVWSFEGSTALGTSWSRSWISFDPVRQRSVLMVADTGFASIVPTRTELNGGAPVLVAQSQVSQYAVAAVYDPHRGGLVATGGWHGVNGQVFPRECGLLQSGAVQWEQIAPSLPAGRKEHGTAYDALRERVVIWGGVGEGDNGQFVGTTPMYLGFGPAAIVRQPAAAVVRAGQQITLRVIAKGGGQVQYRWRKDGVEIHDTVRRRGTARDVLTITGARAEDAGLYDVVVSNPCGREISAAAAAGPCLADFNTDGAIDGDDTIAFFGAWESGSADVNGDGDTDGDDVIAFFARWDAGC